MGFRHSANPQNRRQARSFHPMNARRKQSLHEALPGLSRVLSRLWPYIRKQRGMIAWSSTALIISVAFRLMEPWPLKLIFDSLSQSHSKRTAWLVDALHLQNVDRSRLVIGSCL